MIESQPPCQTDSCTWLNEKVPSVHEGWKRQCPKIAATMLIRSPEMDLRTGECPPAAGYAWADSQGANVHRIQEGGLR